MNQQYALVTIARTEYTTYRVPFTGDIETVWDMETLDIEANCEEVEDGGFDHEIKKVIIE